MAQCPVCRAETVVHARRCFVEAQCPVCLTVASPLFALPCGHVVCEADLSKLGIAAESHPNTSIGYHSRRLGAKARKLACLVVRPCFSLVALYLALTSPGAPVQAFYRLFNLVLGGDPEICADPCFGVHESPAHTCRNHCYCNGGRVCSFFGYCTGEVGECTPSVGAWSLNSSIPLHTSPSTRGSRAVFRQSFWEHNAIASDFSNVSTTLHNSSDSIMISSWSSEFSLGGLKHLALQLCFYELRDVTEKQLPIMSFRLRGPAGYFVRLKLTDKTGRNYTQARAKPMAAPSTSMLDELHDLEYVSEMPAAVLECLGMALQVPCHAVSLELVEVRYAPTFSSSIPFQKAVRRPLHILPRGAFLAEPFDIAGTGRFVLQVFPSGSGKASPGRCSVLISGPPVQMGFILRVGTAIVGTVDEPILCNDAKVGCLVKDAAGAFKMFPWKSLAVSLITVTPLHWYRNSTDAPLT